MAAQLISLHTKSLGWTPSAMRIRRNSGPACPTGIYSAALEDTRTYQPGEFVIGTEWVREATVRLEIDVHLASPHIVSAFEVGGRGRALIPAPFEFLGGQIHWMVVAASDDAG